MSKFKEFKIGDLFEKINTKKPSINVSNASKFRNEEYSVPALTSGLSNQGLTCYVPKDCSEVLKNVISISSNGDSGVAFYQPNDFIVLQDAYAIKFKEKELNEEQYLYFVGALKYIQKFFDWNKKATWNRVKEMNILVPIKKIFTPDWTLLSLYLSGVRGGGC